MKIVRNIAVVCATVALVCAPVIFARAQATAQKQLDASQILAAAKKQAAAQHKNIFLVFGASWCGPCRLLEEFMAAVEMKPILERQFVFAEMHIEEERGKNPQLNTPGGDELSVRLGGSTETGVPYIVFLNEKGEPIVNSIRPGAENVGYPVLPEEIGWFMTMLNKA